MKEIINKLGPLDYKKTAVLTLVITFLFLIPLLLFFLSTNHSASALNLSANFAIGQADLTSGNINASGSATNAFGYNHQSGVVASGTHLFVSDLNNNRVLIYNTIPTASSASASVVIGQPNMASSSANQGATPSAFTLSGPRFIDTNGTKIFIADTNNNRVLIYNTIPASNSASADVVIGQPDMASSSANQGNATPSANTLNQPWSVSYDSVTGKLFIADKGNNRILIYNSVPTTNDATASAVIGQADFTSSTLGTTSSQHLSSPSAARAIQSQLVVADTGNNRVLTFNPIPTANFATASAVIGQTDMASSSANQGGAVAANTLNQPTDIAWDGTRLLVADSGNNRVLAYASIPTTNDASANDAIGQINLTSSSIGTTAATLNNPAGELSFSGTTLFVGDSSNNRVLAFNTFGPSPTPTSTPVPPTSTPTPGPASAPVCSNTAPGAPSALTATAGPASGQISLTWTAPTGTVTDYSITYSDNATSQKWGVVSTGNVTSYVISALSPNVTYYFWVNAVNGCMPGAPVGPASIGSGAVSTTTGATTTSVSNVLYGSGSAALSRSGASSLPATGPQDVVKVGAVGIVLMLLGGALLLAL